MCFRILLHLLLLFVFVGCEMIGNVQVKLSKNKNPADDQQSPNQPMTSGQFYKASIIPGDYENEQQNTIINYLDTTNTLKSIDLGFYGQGFEKVAFVDNYLFFKTQSDPDGGELSLYFINFNLSQPVVVDASSLGCNINSYASIAIHNNNGYCVTNADRLIRFSLDDWSNVFTYSTAIPSESFGYSIRPMEYKGGLLVELDVMSGSVFMHLLGDTVQSFWPSFGGFGAFVTNHGTEGKLLKEITNGFVTLEADFSLIVRRAGNSANKLPMPGVDRTNAGIYFSESFLIYNDLAYYIICNKPGDVSYYSYGNYGIRNYSGDSGLYIANIADIDNITTQRIDLGDVACTTGSLLYELNGDIYLKSSYTNSEGTYLFKYDSADVLVPFKEIAKISEYFRGHNDLANIETWLSTNLIQDTVLNIGDKLCFSAKFSGLYYPSCINASGDLVKVSSVGNYVSEDSFSDAGEFNGELYYQRKNEDDVKLYRSNFTHHSAIINSIVSDNLNMKDYWSYLNFFEYWDNVFKKVIYGKNSNILFVQQVIKESIVKYEDASGEIQSFNYRNMIEEKSEYPTFFAYKDQKYYLHPEGNASSLYHHSNNQKVRVIKEEILFSVLDWREQSLVYLPRYYFYINTNYQLMRFDLETNTKLLIDTNIGLFKRRDNLIVYNKGFSADTNIYDIETSELIRIANPINIFFEHHYHPQAFKLAGGKYLVEFADSVNPMIQSYIYEEGNLTNVTNGDSSALRIFHRLGLAFSNDKYFILDDDDFSYPNTSYLINSQTGVVVREIQHSQEGVSLHGLIKDVITGKSYYNTSLFIDNSSSEPVKKINIVDLQNDQNLEVAYSLPSEMNDHQDFFDRPTFMFFNDKLYVSFNKNGQLRVYELRPNSQAPILKFEHDMNYSHENEFKDTLLNNNIKMFNDNGTLTLTMNILVDDNPVFKRARLVEDEFHFDNVDLFNSSRPEGMHLMHYYIGSKVDYKSYDYESALDYLKKGIYYDDDVERVDHYYLNPEFKLSASHYYDFSTNEYKIRFHELDNFSNTYLGLDLLHSEVF